MQKQTGVPSPRSPSHPGSHVLLRQALELEVLAIAEMKGKHLRQSDLGLEAALVGQGGRVEVVRAFGEILLLPDCADADLGEGCEWEPILASTEPRPVFARWSRTDLRD